LICLFWPKLVTGETRRPDLKSKESPKPIRWLGDSRRKIRTFPEDVKDDIGAALFWAQKGSKHPDAKPLSGFGGAGVLEVVEDHDGDTYRAVYTVKFRERIYVLHCFQKKSKRGNQTPPRDIDLIRERLKQAEQIESTTPSKQVKDEQRHC
jgi:phage-related protein